MRPERKHLFEYGLHKTRTTCMNSSRPSSRPDRSNDDVVCFRACVICNNGSSVQTCLFRNHDFSHSAAP